jgi:hemerythrin
MVIEWNNKYNLGISEIDNQHKKLVKIISKLDACSKKNCEHKQIEIVFNQLLDFALEHFSTEEKYFDKFNYNNKKEHKKEHNSFKKKILGIKQKYLEEGNCSCQELIAYLSDWVDNHLVNEDSKYVDCFKKHGLK